MIEEILKQAEGKTIKSASKIDDCGEEYIVLEMTNGDKLSLRFEYIHYAEYQSPALSK